MGNKLDHPSVELPPEKRVIVTGGNAGIGHETAKSLAEMGARVYIACRSEEKAKAAIERMQREHKNEMQKRSQGQAPSTSKEVEIKPLNVEFLKVDLASLQSTMDFIQEAKQKMQYLNILVCNAGIAMTLQEYTEDNFEIQFQVNYLSHLLIVLHLLPLLRAGSPDSRIVLLSSLAHARGKLDLDNMQGRKSYDRLTAYGSSKAYMIMASHFLARRLGGTEVCTFSVDPGVVDTDIMNNFSDWRLMSFAVYAQRMLGMMRTPKQGAATSVTACVDPSLRSKTQVFMKNCRPAAPATFCCDGKNIETLWRYSLGCLNEFISPDVLKDAFPSAKPEQLAIPKDTIAGKEKVEEKVKKARSSDDQETGEPSEGGKASLEKKQEEEKPDIESSPGATEVALEHPKASQYKKPEDALKDEEKESEASSDRQQVDEQLQKESPSAALDVPTAQAKTDEETTKQKSEESILKDNPPEQITGKPDIIPTDDTPLDVDQPSEKPRQDAKAPTDESLERLKEPSGQSSVEKVTEGASKEGTTAEASSESKLGEGQPETEPSADAAPGIHKISGEPEQDMEVPTENLPTKETSGHESKEKEVMDASKEVTADESSSGSKEVEEQPERESPEEAAPKTGEIYEEAKPDVEAPTENLKTSKDTSGQESEEREAMGDAVKEETAGESSSENKEVEEQPEREAPDEAVLETGDIAQEPKPDVEVATESPETPKETNGQESEEMQVKGDASKEETAGKTSSDVEVLIEKPSSNESEKGTLKDEASTAEAAASSENKKIEEEPEREPPAESAPEIGQTSQESKSQNEVTADEVQSPEMSIVREGLPVDKVQDGPSEDTAALGDSSGMPDDEMSSEKPEEGSVQVPIDTSQTNIMTEEGTSAKAEDEEGKPADEGELVSDEKNTSDAPQDSANSNNGSQVEM